MGIFKFLYKEWHQTNEQKKPKKVPKQNSKNSSVRYQNAVINYLKRKFLRERGRRCPNPRDESEDEANESTIISNPNNSIFTLEHYGVPILTENEFEHFTNEISIYGGFSNYSKGKWFRKNVLMKSFADPADLILFQQELNFLSEVRHPNIISLLGISKIENESYLIFENSNFDSLFSYIHLKRNKYNLEFIKNIGIQLCETFIFLHDKNWVHRSMNSYNLLLNDQMCLKVTGFEYAQQLKQGAENMEDKMTAPFCFYNWLAPEQLFDTPVCKSNDIYSVSLVIWELFLVLIPWKGISYDHLKAHYQQTKTTIPIKNESFPEKIGPILSRGLHYEVSKRDVDFREIIDALASCSHLEPKKTLIKECNTAKVYQLNTIRANDIERNINARTKCGSGAIKRQEAFINNRLLRREKSEKDEERDSYTGLRKVSLNNLSHEKYLFSNKYLTDNELLRRSNLNVNLKNLESQKAIKPASHSLMAQPAVIYDSAKLISPNKNPNKINNRYISNSIMGGAPTLSKNNNIVDSSKQFKKFESIEHLFIDDDNYDNDPNTKLMGSDSLEMDEEPISNEDNLFQDFSHKLSFEDLTREEKLDTEILYNKTPMKRGINWYSFYCTEHEQVTEL